MTTYLALIGNLEKIPAHHSAGGSAQREIKQALEDISTAYPRLFASRLDALGDEFQALLRPEEEGWMRMLDDLETRLIRYPFRMGMGLGGISTAIDSSISIGADGEAFWHARDAISYVHANDAGGKVNTRLIGLKDGWDDTFNSLLEAADTIKRGWTALQDETFRGMIKRGIYSDSFEQKAFAQAIGISESSLTKRLYAGDLSFISGCGKLWKAASGGSGMKLNDIALLFLIAHIIADFYLQSPNLAAGKERNDKALAWHLAIYAAVMLLSALGLTLIQGDPRMIWAGFALSALHAAADLLKYRISKAKRMGSPDAQAWLYLSDQLFHMLCIVLIMNRFTATLPIPSLTLRWILLLSLIHKPANISFKKILSKYEVSGDAGKPDTLPGAGAVIGSLERVLCAILVSRVNMPPSA